MNHKSANTNPATHSDAAVMCAEVCQTFFQECKNERNSVKNVKIDLMTEQNGRPL